VMGGQIDFMITDTATGVPQIKGGKLKALGVSTLKRIPLLPDVPTLDEAGVKGYEMSYWFAAYVPAKTPPAVVAKLHGLLVAATKGHATAQHLRRLEYVAVRSHSETFRILKQLGLDGRLVLTSAHFLALPAIIARTDLAVVMPQAIAHGFVDAERYALLPAALPRSTFTVSIHWSSRFDTDPAHRWLRRLFIGLFKGQIETHRVPSKT